MRLEMSNLFSQERYSGKLEDYIRYQPSFPPEVLNYILKNASLPNGAKIAEIGSGTGKFSRMFLQKGFQVYGVESNEEFRLAAMRLLPFPNFHGIEGDAHSTNLPNKSLDMVIATQIHHYFNPEKAKKEFKRILGTGSPCVLVTSRRLTEESPFMQAYEGLLNEFLPLYASHYINPLGKAELNRFYSPFGYESKTFFITQELDYENLKGRMTTLPYAPKPGSITQERLLERLKRVFDRLEIDRKVKIEYEVDVCFGCLG